MKKLVLLAGIVCFAFTSNATISKVKISKVVVTAADWMKSKDGTWQAMKGGKTVWYKLNAKDASIWMSMDGKKWDAVKDGMWQDKDGKWLKIDMEMLKWSADGGKTWSEVPEWKWSGSDGVWNKFDKDWSLWTMGGKM
jgi:hypothetical protein